MATLTIVGPRSFVGMRAASRQQRRARFRIRQVGPDPTIVELPFAPTEVEYGEIGLSYQEIQRPKEKPLLEFSEKKLRVLSFNVIIADKTSAGLLPAPVGRILNDLTKIANEDRDVVISYGANTYGYRMRITQFDWTSLRRTTDGRVTQAEISLQFNERPQAIVEIVALKALAEAPATYPTHYSSSSSSSSSSEGNPSYGGSGPPPDDEDPEPYDPEEEYGD